MSSDDSTDAAVANVETAAAVLEHIRAHIGPVDTVFHEIESETVAIDIHHVPPTPERNCHTLITSGMSDQPMPEGSGVQFGELVMCLPPDWPMDEEALEDDASAWPIEMLRALGRLPYAHGVAFDFGLCTDNLTLPFDMARDTGFSAVLLAPPVTVPDAFWCLEATNGKVIDFFGIVMLYPRELDCARYEGVVALARALDKLSVNELVQAGRAPAV
jgi:hypothetical protein